MKEFSEMRDMSFDAFRARYEAIAAALAAVDIPRPEDREDFTEADFPVYFDMARAIIPLIVEHFGGSGTDLEAANEWEYGVLFHDQDLDDHYGHTAERALLLAGEVDWRVPEFQRRHPASAWETCPASSVVAAAVGEPVPTERSSE